MAGQSPLPGGRLAEYDPVSARINDGDPRRADMSMFKQPDDVAAAVDLALFEPKPRRRYLVVPRPWPLGATDHQTMRSWTMVGDTRDRNAHESFSHERDVAT
jgi:hypothetical protein